MNAEHHKFGLDAALQSRASSALKKRWFHSLTATRIATQSRALRHTNAEPAVRARSSGPPTGR